MTTYALIAFCVALASFCVWRAVVTVSADQRERRVEKLREKIRKELHDEICNGGNAARIAALRRRLLVLK